jgi:type VI protein secretion system component VasK
MHDKATVITKIYLVGAVWFFVMLATAGALLVSSGAAYSAIDASPLVRAISTLSIAVMVATVVVGIMWSRLRARPRSAQQTPHLAADASDGDIDAALATIG